MPKNLELKIKIKSHQQLRNKLIDVGAKNMGILNQKDVYYTVPEGLLKLRIENGKESLIYYRRDEKAENRWSDYDVLKFENGGGENFLKKIFIVETIVEKKRELYYHDNTRIHLDEVKSLGNFVELETLLLKGKADAKVRFEEIINLLDLNISQQIRKSYRDLLLKKQKSE